MEKRRANPFMRALSVLLCVAMLASYAVLPGAAEEDNTVLTAPDAANLKTGIEVNGMNFYNSDTGVAATYGAWLETMYFDSYYHDSLRSFVDSKAHRWVKPVSLMPAKDTIMGNLSTDITSKIDVTYNSDGSFFLQDWGEQYYAHGWINCSVVVPAWAQTVFFRVDTTGATSDTMFNVILTYQLSDGTSTDGYGNNLTYSFTTCYNAANGTSQDVPAGVSGFDVTGAIPAGATINRIDYYVSGGYQRGITFNDVSLVVSKEANDKTLSVDSETTMLMPGYTAYVIEHMGGSSNLFFVDSIIEADQPSDEWIHQIKPKMMNGFILYVPDDAWGSNGAPSRGDIVTVGWAISDAVFGYDSTYSYPTVSRQFDNTYTVAFYENPANASVVTPFEKDATTYVANSVNATVQMFNYDANINGGSNPLSFWNGFWGYGGDIESEDGAGIEDNTYRFPHLSQELDANGYPMFYPYTEDASGDYYKTTDNQYVLVSSVTDSQGNITDEKVISSVRYRVDKDNPVSIGYLFGNGVTADQYGQAQSNGVTTFAPMANGGGLFRHDPNTGNYFYDSMQNAAWYDAENNKFVLYDSLIVRPWYNSTAGMDYDLSASGAYDKFMDAGFMSSLSVADPESYGNFLPFNKVTTDNITLDGAVYDYTDRTADDRFISAADYSAIVRANILAGTLEKYGLTPAAAQKLLAANKSLGADLVEEIGKTYHYSKGLYTARLEEKMDMWFGMTVDFDFFQPYNGQTKTASGEVNDMVFDFEGDDDVFVYIGVWNDQTNQYDYKLVLDIGGIHEARNGNINFATGAVSYQDCYGKNVSTTLGEIFDLDTDTFDDFEKLSLKFFYMERGGNISCCRLSFNLPTLPNNSLTVSKALDTAVLGTQTYKFRVLKTELDGENQYVATEESLIPAGTYYFTGTSEAVLVDANGYFEMDPGQSVTFNDIAQYITDNNYYYVVEETITSAEVDGQYTPASPEYTLNGSSPLQAKGGLVSGGVYVYRTEPMKMDVGEGNTTNLVGFTNLVDTSKLGSLHITKQIKDGANISADASFDMRVTLGGSLLPVGTQYKIYSAGDTENFTVATVKTRGIVTLKAGQTVVIERILSTSTIEVVEDSAAYSASYYSESSSIKCSGSGAVGTMPLGGTIEIIVTNDDSNVITDKTVSSVAGSTDRFILTLEAFATGKTNTVALTAPADIVLVLDQSASMYTPKGAGADQYTYTDDVKLNSNLTRYDLAATLDPNVTIAGTSLNLEKAAKAGYYVAQSKTPNRTNTAVGDIYDWFVVQYDKAEDKWYYNRVTSTTVSVEFFKDQAVAYDASSGAQYNDVVKKFTTTIVADEPIDTLYYYESQYAALYESVINFADNLKSTGVDHRISIVGFSSPYYDGIKAYNGSGVYVGSDYYLYDTDYKYKGFLFGGNYVLYAPRDGDVYQSMGAGILPDSLEGTTWIDYIPQGVTEEDWVILDVSEAFAASYFGYSSQGENVLRPAGSLADYVAGCVSDSVYQQALVSVKSDELTASIEAITTNFQQTCPAAGLEMAKNILNNRADTSRDEIVILFTDGVPTVGMYSDNEDATSQNATTKETYWSGLAGAAQAINLAYEMKQDAQNPVQIYTIGTSGLAADVPNAYGVRADSITSITGEEFLDCVSSNYANATAEHVVTPGQYTDSVKSSVLTVTNGTAARTIDYSKTSSDGSVSVAFDQIMTDVSSASVTLDADAVLKEYLSDYFDLDLLDASEIKLYVAPYAGISATGTHLFGDRIAIPYGSYDAQTGVYRFNKADPAFTLGVSLSSGEDADGTLRENVVVNVTGFDYAANYVHVEDGVAYGYKLIVEVPVRDRAGFWGGNNIPTNKDSTAIYDGDLEVQDFPMPEVNIPVDPEISANDVTVYYGNPVSESDLGVTIHINSKDFDDPEKAKVTINPDGTFTPAQSWMDDFATLYWENENMNPADSNDTAVSTEQNGHTYSVILQPNDTGDRNTSRNPSNMAGDPVVPGTEVTGEDGSIIDQKASTTATVYVLIPVVTFQDSTIDYGTIPDAAYFGSINKVGEAVWVDSLTSEGKAATQGSAPELIYLYAAVGNTANGANFASDTKINVSVEADYTPDTETDATTNITSVVKFNWVVCESKLDSGDETAHSILTPHSGSVNTHEFWIHVSTYAVDDAVVIDFGLSVPVHVLLNDHLVSSENPTVVGFATERNGARTETFAGTYGTATLTDGVVTYSLNKAANAENGTLSGMQMKEKEDFYYVIAYTVDGVEKYYYAKITVIPATSIYFEDDFISYTSTTFETDAMGNIVNEKTQVGGWTAAFDGSAAKDSQDEDRPGDGLVDAFTKADRYGYDSHYTGMSMYSNGSAQWVTVNGSKYAKASFTFWGTGFDVISLTSSDSGTIVVSVEPIGTTGDTLYYIVDTYYGYAYGDHDQDPSTPDEWYVDTSATDVLYQVPVIKVDMNDAVKTADDPATPDVDETEYFGYGQYKVTITATYASFFDHKQEDGAYSSYDFYLDSIRVYNPANDGLTQDGTDEYGNPVYDSTIQDAYQADGEGWPTYEELRNLLIDKDAFDALGSDGTVNGMVFIDGIPVLNGSTADSDAEMPKDEDGNVIVKKAEIATYMNYGPNNELYLASGQGVAFTLQAGTMVMDEFGDEVLDTGNIASVQLALKTVGSSALVQIGYYEDGRIVWLDTVGGADGMRIETATDMYYDITALNGKTVIIKNGGDAGVLSITNIKTTHWANPTQMVFSLFGGRTRNIAFMLTALNTYEEAPEQNVPGTDGEQSPETGDVNIELFALVTLTACVIMLAVLILPSVHKRIVK